MAKLPYGPGFRPRDKPGRRLTQRGRGAGWAPSPGPVPVPPARVGFKGSASAVWWGRGPGEGPLHCAGVDGPGDAEPAHAGLVARGDLAGRGRAATFNALMVASAPPAGRQAGPVGKVA